MDMEVNRRRYTCVLKARVPLARSEWADKVYDETTASDHQAEGLIILYRRPVQEGQRPPFRRPWHAP